MNRYIIGIDQSTQGTKALLFDGKARLIDRADMPHEQKISREGYVSHDLNEIWSNTLAVIKALLINNEVKAGELKGLAISNQRETTAAWDKETGEPLCDAIVWQCARAQEICEAVREEDAEYVKEVTGLPVSPYFPAGKMAWVLTNVPRAGKLAKEGKLCMGTIDSFLLYKLTEGREFKTDYSNASRTQLFHLEELAWDEKCCEIFGIPMNCLPQICDSDSLFGWTNLEGIWEEKIPVHAMLGDSHGALYGQGCHESGGVKATYGTGSSLMMNTGEKCVHSAHGIATSLAWKIGGKVNYVLEGNLNYTGAVITWLKDDVELIASAKETEQLALEANQEDTTYLIPAFSGLGAPYWKSDAKAMLYGMRRGTGKKEIVKAALDCIAYQITDVLEAMEKDSGVKLEKLCVDGGPTRNGYLMKRQSDMAQTAVLVPDAEEMSGIGVAYLAGITLGVFAQEEAFSNLHYKEYHPELEKERREVYYEGWKDAVRRVIQR